MSNDITTTITGNLVHDPELRFTPSGTAVANIRIASTARQFDKATNRYVDGVTTFLDATMWRGQAENVAESLKGGDRVIVTGRLRQRGYETKDGEKRTTFEVQVDAIGPELTWATAQVTKARRDSSELDAEDPWATPAE